MLLRSRLLWQFLKIHSLTLLGCGLLTTGVFWLTGLFSAPGTPTWISFVLINALGSSIIGAMAFARLYIPIIDDVNRSLQKVTSGDYSARFSLAAQDEFEEISTSFERMTDQIDYRATLLSGDRNRLRTVIDSMLEGVIAVNASQQVVLLNAAASRLFGIRETSSLGRPLWELIRNTRIRQLLDRCFEQGTRVTGEMASRTSPQSMLAISVLPLPGETMDPISGKPGAIIVIADVTELRRLESVRQEFVANASHELKTPLASIQACTETLLNGGADDPEIRDRFLRLIDESALRLNLLVQDMLTLARSETQRQLLDLAQVRFEDVASICLSRQLQAAERKQILLQSEPSSEPLFLMADDEALEEVVDNLLGNAIKYTNAGGTVSLRWKREGNQGIIEVQDTGIGIPGDQLPRIFERFYRVDRHRSRDLGGTGLGLSIVKHLVQSIGGKITVESRLNVGSTFRVRVPLAGL